jgi:hypothetical protein
MDPDIVIRGGLGGRLGEVRAVHRGFFVWREKIDVEYWVNAPLRGKF